MGDDQLAGPCTGDVGIANSVGVLWQLGGDAWLVVHGWSVFLFVLSH